MAEQRKPDPGDVPSKSDIERRIAAVAPRKEDGRGKNPNSKKNLKPPWPKGMSGNPGGRPKRLPISDLYRELGETLLPDSIRERLKLEEGATYNHALALILYHEAFKGSIGAVREIREAVEGLAPQRLEIATTDRKETVIRVVYVKGDVKNKAAIAAELSDEPRTIDVVPGNGSGNGNR